jgi:hypothetical protein
MKNIYVEKNRKARHDINRAVIATIKFSEKYVKFCFWLTSRSSLDLLGLIKSFGCHKVIDDVAWSNR